MTTIDLVHDVIKENHDYEKSIRKIKKHISPEKSAKKDKNGDCEGWDEYGFQGLKTIKELIEKKPFGDIKRIDGSAKITWTKENFKKSFDSTSTPALIRNLTSQWPATSKWNMAALLLRFPGKRFVVGKTADGEEVFVKLNILSKYMRENDDDVPFGVFDSLEADSIATSLKKDFTPPELFEDLFRCARDTNDIPGELHPPYLWFIIGAERGGIGPKQYGVHSWDALISGRKRWVFIPKEAPVKLIKCSKVLGGLDHNEAMVWFDTILPSLKEQTDHKIIECIQEPGDIVFIPGGWWHVCLNLTDVIGVRQNFVSKTNYESVALQMVKGSKHHKWAHNWQKEIIKSYPDLAEIAHTIKHTKQEGTVTTTTDATESFLSQVPTQTNTLGAQTTPTTTTETTTT